MGYMDEDGFLFITGRTTRVVITWDHKVSLDVIETKIRSFPEIADVAVVQNESKQEIAAFITPNKHFAPEERMDPIRNGGTSLSIFEIPDRIEMMEDLPKINNGSRLGGIHTINFLPSGKKIANESPRSAADTLNIYNVKTVFHSQIRKNVIYYECIPQQKGSCL